MNRDFHFRLIVLGLTIVGVFYESRTYAWASPGLRVAVERGRAGRVAALCDRHLAFVRAAHTTQRLARR